MNSPRSRRHFLAEVGRGMLLSTVGVAAARELGLATALADEPDAELNFGSMERLVRLMQETPPEGLMSFLVDQWRSGTDLQRLTGAAALANARTFGGEDYVGFHTMMALAPAFHMSQELTGDHQALPVFKVLYRNTSRIREFGGRNSEVLRAVEPGELSEGRPGAELLREAVRGKDVAKAEQTFAGLMGRSADEAFNDLLWTVQDSTEVHRVVLPYRAWDMLGILGRDQAHTLLRQSVRYCVRNEAWAGAASRNEPRSLLPRLMEEHRLIGRDPGDRVPDDSWVEALSRTIFEGSPEGAASAAAAALAEGMAPASVGEAISLAANQLVLRDHGRTPREEQPGKTVGSVHGDSIGVHASDSANAWRNLARVANARNTFACLILGAYQVALDRSARGGDFLNWTPVPVAWHLDQVKETGAEALLKQTEEAIRANLQARASALIHRYGEQGYESRPVFDLMLRYAVSEDGALHAEKFYRTVREEFDAARPAFRWRYLVGLARVTASEYGRPAAGVAEARALLKV